jgi:hypothetical protein
MTDSKDSKSMKAVLAAVLLWNDRHLDTAAPKHRWPGHSPADSPRVMAVTRAVTSGVILSCGTA